MKREVGIVAWGWSCLLPPIYTLKQDHPESPLPGLTAGKEGCRFLLDQRSRDRVIPDLWG